LKDIANKLPLYARNIKCHPMKKALFTLLFFLVLQQTGTAQYYYKDLLSSRQASMSMAGYKERKIRLININSFESDGQATEDFFCQKKIAKDYASATLYTKTSLNGSSTMQSFFDAQGRLIKTHDSARIASSHISYQYNTEGRLIKIVSQSNSADDDYVNSITEEHLYVYQQDSLPLKMIRVRNGKDSTVILFSLDENHHIAIEKDTKTGAKYYYYYDAEHRLTDIVHTNEYKQKLIADYLFEYGDNSQISQMTTTEEGENNYTIWKYRYDNNLRVEERLFSKDHVLLGRIEYEYK